MLAPAVQVTSFQRQQPPRCRAAACRSAQLRQSTRLHVQARFGGGSVLDRPEVDLSGRGPIDATKDMDASGGSSPATDTGHGSTDRQRRAPAGGGDFRVILLDSPQHTEKKVVQAITRVIPGVDDLHAKNVFQTSKDLGKAIVATALKEHAEHYAQQLYSYGLRSTIEPDSSTM